MDQDAAVIRRQIEETRAELAKKLGLLQERVLGTVRETQAGVESVRTTVNESIQTVQRALDVHYQIRQHPWLTLGGCVLAGFALAKVAKRPQVSNQESKTPANETLPDVAGANPSTLSNGKNSVQGRFQEEIDMVKGILIGVAMGYFRDSAKQALPQLAPQIQVVMDSVTVKLGGTPIAGPFATASPDPGATGQSDPPGLP